MQKIIILFGVSGSGKSCIGKKLSEDLKIKFIEGDDFHSINNINKMKKNSPLNDNDRKEWLLSINHELKKEIKKDVVLACSALKEIYRKKLINGVNANIFWFCLNGEFELINQRLNKRTNHFFKSDLLKSQFEIIEYPDYSYFIDIDKNPEKIVETIKLKVFK